MMQRSLGLALVAVAFLMASPAYAAETAADSGDIECAGPFARDASEASLVEAFGAEEVVRKTIDGPEGSTLDATVVYPDDPDWRLVVLWHDEARRALPNAIIVEGELSWVAPGGVALGASLADVQAINGAPFTLTGFGWDYGGSASFPKGALAKLPGGCILGLTFDLPDSVGEGFDAIMGDRELSSADALVKKAKPTVGRIQVGYPAP